LNSSSSISYRNPATKSQPFPTAGGAELGTTRTLEEEEEEEEEEGVCALRLDDCPSSANCHG